MGIGILSQVLVHVERGRVMSRLNVFFRDYM
jgi:hypothetical protein